MRVLDCTGKADLGEKLVHFISQAWTLTAPNQDTTGTEEELQLKFSLIAALSSRHLHSKEVLIPCRTFECLCCQELEHASQRQSNDTNHMSPVVATETPKRLQTDENTTSEELEESEINQIMEETNIRMHDSQS